MDAEQLRVHVECGVKVVLEESAAVMADRKSVV